MPMDKVPRSNPISKRDFHSRLRTWLSTGDDRISGKDKAVCGWPWIHVQDSGSIYNLQGDSKRDGVQAYLGRVADQGDDIPWFPVPNQQNGSPNAIAFDPDRGQIPGFYLFVYL
jgi:hypothetical protein